MKPGRTRCWGAEIIPLQAINAHFSKDGRILRIFNKLRHCQHIKMVSDRDHRGGQRPVIRVFSDAFDEFTVNLEDIKIEVLL